MEIPGNAEINTKPELNPPFITLSSGDLLAMCTCTVFRGWLTFLKNNLVRMFRFTTGYHRHIRTQEKKSCVNV